MFIRIVKMRFHEDKIEAFLSNFEAVKQHIRNFEGNQFLELYQDKNDQRIFFTYSYWESEKDLENYRKSAFFNEVWDFTKKLFNDKPEAWSVDKISPLAPKGGMNNILN
jgi:heme-degrading monooxygenase HmoA